MVALNSRISTSSNFDINRDGNVLSHAVAGLVMMWHEESGRGMRGHDVVKLMKVMVKHVASISSLRQESQACNLTLPKGPQNLRTNSETKTRKFLFLIYTVER